MLYQEVKERGVEVVGVWAYQKTHLEPVLRQTGATFPIGTPTDGVAMDIYTATHTGMSWFPFHVLVDGDGTIQYLASDYDAAALRREIDLLTAQSRQ